MEIFDRLKKDGVEVELEREEMDCFHPGSGHFTRPSGRYTVVLMGVSHEDAIAIENSISAPRHEDDGVGE